MTRTTAVTLITSTMMGNIISAVESKCRKSKDGSAAWRGESTLYMVMVLLLCIIAHYLWRTATANWSQWKRVVVCQSAKAYKRSLSWVLCGDGVVGLEICTILPSRHFVGAIEARICTLRIRSRRGAAVAALDGNAVIMFYLMQANILLRLLRGVWIGLITSEKRRWFVFFFQKIKSRSDSKIEGT